MFPPTAAAARHLPLLLVTAGILVLAGLGFSGAEISSVLFSSHKPGPVPELSPLPSERSLEPGLRYPSIAINLIVDPTSSTKPDYVTDAKERLANVIDSLFVSNQGRIYVFVNAVGSRSFTSESTLLSFSIPEAPKLPSRQPVKPRPEKPDYGPCQKDTFNKQRCIEKLNSSYEEELAESAAEEARVHANYEAELAIFDNSMAAARSAANAQIERLRNLPVPSSDVGSDIVGAWLVAGQNLASVRADFELVLAQSDLRDFGPASQGVLRISGVHAVILNWDVDDATEAERLEKFWAAKLREAGAASVRFLTPAQTAVADLLEGM